MNIEAARADQASAGADFGLKNAPQLLIEGVTRTFPGARGKPPTQALLPIDFAVRENDFVTILGPSGCGKSTLLRIVAGLDFPTSGQVLLDGARITGPGADRGVVFQSYTLFPWLTVRDNVCFGLRERGLPRAQQIEIAQELADTQGVEYVVPAGMSEDRSMLAFQITPSTAPGDEATAEAGGFQAGSYTAPGS